MAGQGRGGIRVKPDISVVIPAYNEGPRLAQTIESIAGSRTTNARVEIVIIDDASTDGTQHYLKAAWSGLSKLHRLDVHLCQLDVRGGVPRARNYGVGLATGELLFMTDAHVTFSTGWDETIQQKLRPDWILAGAVADTRTPFVGYGCHLVVPFMGTYWNDAMGTGIREVQIAACPATALTRELFDRIGGYDDGMKMYGAAEPEFSVRAWLTGAEIMLVPQLVVNHRFKPRTERVAFLRERRQNLVHNSLRFGLLYSSEAGAMQLLRYYAKKFPDHFAAAVSDVDKSDVWQRRDQLQQELKHDFPWYVEHFQLKDQAGGEIRC
jgi:glycosyltransferase involved in cell wall biosynthesis